MPSPESNATGSNSEILCTTFISTRGETGSTRYLEVVVLRRGGSNPLGSTNFNNPGVVQLAGDVGFKLRSVWVRVPPPGPNFNSPVVQFLAETHHSG